MPENSVHNHCMRFFVPVFILTAFLFITSCSYKQDQILFQEKSSIDSARHANVETLETYRIQPQDILQVRNLQNMSYGQTYQVEEDGNVALPVIGRVPVVGLTRMEATQKIEDLYRKTLLKDPIIEVKIVNLKVTVLGEIKAQGNYPLLKDKTTLVEMIGEAGGLTENANETNIEIIRGSQENAQVTVVNLRDRSSISSPETILHNGDIIYIAKNRRAIRNDKVSTFSTVIQPILIITNIALVIYALVKH
jgi:polysaccharide biosynthesis/export protein